MMAGIRRMSAASQHSIELGVKDCMKIITQHMQMLFVIPETRADAFRQLGHRLSEISQCCFTTADLLASLDREEVTGTNQD